MCYGQLLSEKLRTARKVNKRRCFWCDEQIAPGDKYQDHRVADEGSIAVIVTHVECLPGVDTLDGDFDGCIFKPDPPGVRGSTRRVGDPVT